MKTQTINHSPLPTIKFDGPTPYFGDAVDNQFYVANLDFDKPGAGVTILVDASPYDDEDITNTVDRIELAVNSHSKLVELLQFALDNTSMGWLGNDFVAKAQAVLKEVQP